jgi:CheY-like chemotaxis protein
LRQSRILYADDYDLVLFTVKQMLEQEGWRVDVCRDGAGALKRIEGEEQYQLLIFDERLPGASGLELIRRVRASERLRNTPILMFTATPCEEQALAAGADAFLNKPGGIGELIETCRRFLANGNGDARVGVAVET